MTLMMFFFCMQSGVTSLTGQRPGLVVPMSPQSIHGLPHGGHMKTVGKPTIQIKQEGGKSDEENACTGCTP